MLFWMMRLAQPPNMKNFLFILFRIIQQQIFFLSNAFTDILTDCVQRLLNAPFNSKRWHPPPLPGNLRVFDSGPYPGSGEFDTKGTPGVQDLKRARVRWEIWTETVLKVSPAEYSQVSIFVIEEIQIWFALTPAQRTQYWRQLHHHDLWQF